MSKLTFVFVHGLSGWGSYDAAYQRMPYWGMRGGDLIACLRGQGFDCYAASVAPTGSAWDRACELYAQLAGSRVDYGKAHSAEYRHERFGRDFSACPLIPAWGDETRLVLLGHSFGGATVRLFSELLAHGDAAEQEAGADSPLFRGGLEHRIHSLVTLASPMNGTTAYDLFADPAFDPSAVRVPRWSRIPARMMSLGTRPKQDARDPRDYACYDMRVDQALALNRRIRTLPNVYYFSVPCRFTDRQQDGTHRPRKGMEPLFFARSCQIGAYAGTTPGGVALDESWRENDGLVNTLSARAPLGEPAQPLDEGRIPPGIWNVLPTVEGDHMWPQGGLLRRHEIRDFYLKLLRMIASCPAQVAYRVTVNGIEVVARYSQRAIREVFLPLLQRLSALQRRKGKRILVLLAAPPGAGKSTLASFLAELSGTHPELQPVQVIGMDGFHRRQEYLQSHFVQREGRELPMVEIKGAPVTFDLEKLTESVRQVASGGVCGWPVYDRLLHNPTENALRVDGQIILLEGNYLLLDEDGWRDLRSMADYTISIRADVDLLRRRLIDRRIRTGVDPEPAVRFVDFSDMPNVRLCLRETLPADLELALDADGDCHPVSEKNSADD